MAKTQSRNTAAASPAATVESLSELAHWQGAAFNAATQATQSYINGIAAVNREIASFMQIRLRRDVELGQSLARCRTWSESTKAHSDWWMQATEDYSTEAEKLFELNSSLFRETLTPIEQSTATAKTHQAQSGESQPD